MNHRFVLGAMLAGISSAIWMQAAKPAQAQFTTDTTGGLLTSTNPILAAPPLFFPAQPPSDQLLSSVAQNQPVTLPAPPAPPPLEVQPEPIPEPVPQPKPKATPPVRLLW
jgi:outer membrane biosynthesis protein TonB